VIDFKWRDFEDFQFGIEAQIQAADYAAIRESFARTGVRRVVGHGCIARRATPRHTCVIRVR
jgi:hypothetical protein